MSLPHLTLQPASARARWLALSLSVLVFALPSCSRQPQSPQSSKFGTAASDADSEPPKLLESAPAAAPAEARMAGGAASAAAPAGVSADQISSSAATATDPQRHFVRTAKAKFRVKDVYASTLSVEDAVAAEGGFVVRNRVIITGGRTTRVSQGDGTARVVEEATTTGSLVVRVPSERAQRFLRTVAEKMAYLDDREFSAEDVQFDLLRRQLAYARAQELQQEIRAAASQPGKTPDKVDAVEARAQMLEARDEARVSEREMDDRIAFATLSLDLTEPPKVRVYTEPDVDSVLRDSGQGFFSRAGDALGSGWRGLKDVSIGLLMVWPLWVFVALFTLILRLILRRLAARKRVAERPAPPPLQGG